MKKPSTKSATTPTEPENTGVPPPKQDPAGREFERAQPKVPKTTTRDKWGDLEGQQGGQGWEEK